MKLIDNLKEGIVAIIFFVVVIFLLGIIATSTNTGNNARNTTLTSLTGHNAVEFRQNDTLVGAVKSCIAYPTNNPLIYVVEVQVDDRGNRRVCVSSVALTNNEPVAIRDLMLYDNMSRNVPIAVQLSKFGTNILISDK